MQPQTPFPADRPNGRQVRDQAVNTVRQRINKRPPVQHDSEPIGRFRAGFLVGLWAGAIITCAFAWVWAFVR